MVYRRTTPAAAAQSLEVLVDDLEHYREESRRLTRELGESIASCVRRGATWGEIGEVLGMTKQAARAHWRWVLDEPDAAQ